MSQALAQFNAPGGGARPGGGIPRESLSSRQKAAVIVRLLLSEGAPLPLTALPDDLQTALTEQIATMRTISRDTLRETVQEFLDALDGIGLSFPGGLDGALSFLDGHISASAASRLRRMAGAAGAGDPWQRLAAADLDDLVPMLQAESTEVGAVMLSKLPVSKAAELLGRMPGDQARRTAYAMSLTNDVHPDTVRRIGIALATQLDARPPKAFDGEAGARVGAILNIAAANTREEVLRGLDAADKTFAEAVRKAIFIFDHIPERLNPLDVPRVVRQVEQPVLVTALAAALAGAAPLQAAAEHLLANMSQRLAQGLREDVEMRGKVREKDGDAAMTAVVGAIRDLALKGEITLRSDDEEDG